MNKSFRLFLYVVKLCSSIYFPSSNRTDSCDMAAQGKEYAIKVYKTSIMVFKDRDKYVSGEYRYRHGYCRSNPRKMVKVCADVLRVVC